MDRVCVVTRQLPGNQVVVSGVLAPPEKTDKELTDFDYEVYFADAFRKYKEMFCKNFPEFKKATWNFQVEKILK